MLASLNPCRLTLPGDSNGRPLRFTVQIWLAASVRRLAHWKWRLGEEGESMVGAASFVVLNAAVVAAVGPEQRLEVVCRGGRTARSDPERARTALALIKSLFDVEERIARAPLGKRRATIARDSKPLVERFFHLCYWRVQIEAVNVPVASVEPVESRQATPARAHIELPGLNAMSPVLSSPFVVKFCHE
jgi:hypothetical protein